MLDPTPDFPGFDAAFAKLLWPLVDFIHHARTNTAKDNNAQTALTVVRCPRHFQHAKEILENPHEPVERLTSKVGGASYYAAVCLKS